MNKRFIALILSCLSVFLAAQETSMETAVEAGFTLHSFQNEGETDAWRTGESVRLALSARNANSLVIRAEIESDFSGTPVTADKALRELSLSFSPAHVLVITAGKQNVKWGTARVFSAIDSLAPPLDPLNPTDSGRGVTGIRAELIPTWWMSVSTLALPSPLLGNTRLALRAEFLAGETDLALGAVRTVNEEGTEEPVMTADFARFFDRFGIYGEAQLVRKKEWKPSATGGLQIDIPAWLNGTVTLLGEYRWDGENDYTGHMLYAGLSGIPVTRKISAGIGFLGAPEKLKGVATADLDWRISQSMSARLGYEYLADEEAGGADFIPLFTVYRHRVSAGVTAFY